MTNETIQSVIDRANGEDPLIFRCEITPTVSFAKIWLKEPDGDVPDEQAYDFYLISEEGTVVAAVLDMKSVDLHAYTAPEYRGRGLMTRAMEEVILPQLLAERIILNINFVPEARSLVEQLGFKIESNSDKASLKRGDFPPVCAKPKQPAELDEAFLKQNVRKALGYLRIAADQVETAGFSEFSEELRIEIDGLCEVETSLMFGDWKQRSDATRQSTEATKEFPSGRWTIDLI